MNRAAEIWLTSWRFSASDSPRANGFARPIRWRHPIKSSEPVLPSDAFAPGFKAEVLSAPAESDPRPRGDFFDPAVGLQVAHTVCAGIPTRTSLGPDKDQSRIRGNFERKAAVSLPNDSLDAGHIARNLRANDRKRTP